MVRYLILITSILFTYESWTQERITWVQWEEGIQQSIDQDKKVIIDLYTKWCGWCKKMDNTTFSDSTIVDYINENYIAIKFDAEHRGDLIYGEEVYKFTKGGRRGYHALAAKMTHGRLRYPTIVFLDENAEVIQALPGFQSANNLEKILTYFAGDHHKKTPWPIYQMDYDRKKNAPRTTNKNTRLVSGKGI